MSGPGRLHFGQSSSEVFALDDFFQSRFACRHFGVMGSSCPRLSFEVGRRARIFGQHGRNIVRGTRAHAQATASIGPRECGRKLAVPLFNLLLSRPDFRQPGNGIAPYAMDYIRVILLGAPYMTASLVLNNLLRFQGNAFYGMLGLTSGGILNIVLDPILIFGCRLGISGAAWATIISQLVGFLILFYQCNHAGIVKIRLRNVRISGALYRKIVNGGLPSLLRQGVASLATICLNLAAKPYGDAAIAAMAIVSRIANFTNSVIIGFGQGFQPP